MPTAVPDSPPGADHDQARPQQPNDEERAEQRRDALAERLFLGLLAGMELLSIDLGGRLGLYAALERHGPLTPGELTSRAGVAERYAREWLEQQAVAAILDVEAEVEAAADRRYLLPAAHAAVLVEVESPAYLWAQHPR